MKEVKDRNKMNKSKISIVLFILILFLGFYFRFYGVNWDQGQHLHPDERFLTMVTGAIQWPKNVFEYLDSSSSPLNPHNKGFGFFVYGTFPIFFSKWFIDTFAKENYNSITLIGRQLSAMVDLGTVVLVFLIAKQIISNSKLGQLSTAIRRDPAEAGEIRSIRNLPLLSMFLYSIMVLPIQLSHFYAVDTYLVFFITLTIYFLIKFINNQQINPSNNKLSIFNIIFLGISLGLATASKITALLILPTIGLGLLYWLIKNRNLKAFVLFCFLLFVSCYLTVRFAQPYAFAENKLFSFIPNPKFINNMQELKGMDNPKSTFPPAIQWRNRASYIFPLNSIIFHGLGIPLGILTVFGFIYTCVILFRHTISAVRKHTIFKFIQKLPETDIYLLLITVYILTVYIYQGKLYTMNMRYFASLYPFLGILAAYFLLCLIPNIKQIVRTKTSQIFVLSISFLSVLIWPVSFLSIYERPHSRVEASSWIYDHIPKNSTISFEIWDDPLPLNLPEHSSGVFQYVEMPMYDPDVKIKWQKVTNSLDKADYIIMSSNRLWGSIPRVPQLYPLASEYYKALFDGSLGFEKIKDITSTPCFPSASICLLKIDDTNAEESFTVYDHPQVLIFKKKNLNKNLVNSWYQQSL